MRTEEAATAVVAVSDGEGLPEEWWLKGKKGGL